MIGYIVSLDDLKALIEAEKPGWLGRADTRTNNFCNAGLFNESSSIWSEIKVVYMRLQGGEKCAFCERKLESETYGNIEQDVEHFRPKGLVTPWNLPASLAQEGIVLANVPDPNNGYFLLAYHPFNYAASCKPCNSILKASFFPVKSRHDFTVDNPVNLTHEQAYLIYPIGDFDSDPEALISFHGLSPQAAAAGGFDRERGLVTIEFFKLDDPIGRKNLFVERAWKIVSMFPSLVAIADGAVSDIHEQIIQICISPNSSHANCARSFQRLFDQDRNEAEEVYWRAMDFLGSVT